MNVREQHTVVIGNETYLITAFDATFGLNVMSQLQKMGESNELPSGAFVKGVVLNCVSWKNKMMTEELFNTHFSKKYKELMELFKEILNFNFGEEGPNDESGTSE